MRPKSTEAKLFTSPSNRKNRKNGQTGGKLAGGSSLAALAVGLVLGGWGAVRSVRICFIGYTGDGQWPRSLDGFGARRCNGNQRRCMPHVHRPQRTRNYQVRYTRGLDVSRCPPSAGGDQIRFASLFPLRCTALPKFPLLARPTDSCPCVAT